MLGAPKMLVNGSGGRCTATTKVLHPYVPSYHHVPVRERAGTECPRQTGKKTVQAGS